MGRVCVRPEEKVTGKMRVGDIRMGKEKVTSSHIFLCLSGFLTQ